MPEIEVAPADEFPPGATKLIVAGPGLNVGVYNCGGSLYAIARRNPCPDQADRVAPAHVVERTRADRGAQPGVILAPPEQISKREDHSENHDQQHEEPDQVPALQNEIAAAVFVFGCHLCCF